MKFGRLLRIGKLDAQGRVLFRCDCGTERLFWWANVKSGRTQSCGCLQAGMRRARVVHGHAVGNKVTSTYRSWAHMVQRVTNPSNPSYPDYGGRGITLDPRWLTFANFLADMGEKPRGTEIDRRDNERGYSKENCRWVPRIVNANNTRRSRLIEYGGRTLSISEAAREVGIKPHTVFHRIDRLGWSIDAALNTPIRKNTHV